jgi:hypothetical protein
MTPEAAAGMAAQGEQQPGQDEGRSGGMYL